MHRVAHRAVPLLLACDEADAVVFVGFVGETGAAREALARRATRYGAQVVQDAGRHAAADQLVEYLEGKRRDFELSIALHGTEFQCLAWKMLREIPYGQTRTYGDQARAIRRPTAVRAVGHANGDNPIPVIVPCHRVLGADGALTGFGGGVETKRWLLELERNPGHPPTWTPSGGSPRHSNAQLGLSW